MGSRPTLVKRKLMTRGRVISMFFQMKRAHRGHHEERGDHQHRATPRPKKVLIEEDGEERAEKTVMTSTDPTISSVLPIAAPSPGSVRRKR